MAPEHLIGLVDEHHAVGIVPQHLFDLPEAGGDAGGGIGIGDKHPAVLAMESGKGRGIIRMQRDGVVLHLVELAIYLIEGIGDVKEGDGLFLFEKGRKGL